MYMAAKNAVFGWTMGITHHVHGVENVQMIANLALLRGMVGRPNAGLLPIRGHSNVQGMGSVGVTPQLKQAILTALEQRLGLRVSAIAGLDTMACMEAAAEARCETALCLGGNLFGSNPDAAFATQALGKLRAGHLPDTTLNTGHAWGTAQETLILPVLPRDEEPQPTTQESMFNFVRLSDGGPARYHGTAQRSVGARRRSAGMVLGDERPVNWSELESHQRIRELIADLIPGSSRWPTSTGRGRSSTSPAATRHAAFPTELRQSQVPRDRVADHVRAERASAAADDGALGGAVQHGRLRGGRHLPRPGAARRDPDEPGGHRTAGPDARSARDGAQRGRRVARAARAAVRHPRRATR